MGDCNRQAGLSVRNATQLSPFTIASGEPKSGRSSKLRPADRNGREAVSDSLCYVSRHSVQLQPELVVSRLSLGI
jgi:hypothetical protein